MIRIDAMWLCGLPQGVALGHVGKAPTGKAAQQAQTSWLLWKVGGVTATARVDTWLHQRPKPSLVFVGGAGIETSAAVGNSPLCRSGSN